VTGEIYFGPLPQLCGGKLIGQPLLKINERLLPFLLILIVLGGAVGATAWYMKRSATRLHLLWSETDRTCTCRANGTWCATPAHRRPADAPATLEEFGDFQFHPWSAPSRVETMEKEFGPKLRVIFREFPLVPAHEHALAPLAAEVPVCRKVLAHARHHLRESKAWHDVFDVRLFLKVYPQESDSTSMVFRSDLSSARSGSDYRGGKRGRSLNVKGTPQFFSMAGFLRVTGPENYEC